MNQREHAFRTYSSLYGDKTHIRQPGLQKACCGSGIQLTVGEGKPVNDLDRMPTCLRCRQRICPVCGGVGAFRYLPRPETCFACGGTGLREDGKLTPMETVKRYRR